MKSVRLLTTWVALACGAGQVFAASSQANPAQPAYDHANPNAAFLRGSTAGTTANASSIQRATGGASLNLAGQVSVSCTVTIAATAKTTSLDLKAGEQNQSVGVITETCNSSSGYTVSISSRNGGQLRSGDASAPLTSYTASYDDATGSIASGLSAIRNGAFFGRTGNLLINIPANAQAIASNYSDSISLVIAAK
ncbi:hypothetical protein [Malikia sp.]|uniref:hypothetical protein n=1 Tax=Malikia sp. TaxID=2070706 RepID=UPI002612E807|nr:hypothetical protein [Malikia sp.]MDD2729940.1 hypothetical protein [Malikia sp.]